MRKGAMIEASIMVFAAIIIFVVVIGVVIMFFGSGMDVKKSTRTITSSYNCRSSIECNPSRGGNLCLSINNEVPRCHCIDSADCGGGACYDSICS